MRFDPSQWACAHKVLMINGKGFSRQEQPMLDVLLLGLAVVFFAGSIAYVYACDRL